MNFAVFQVCVKLNQACSLCIVAPKVFFVLGTCFVFQSFVSFLVLQFLTSEERGLLTVIVLFMACV